MSVEYNWDAENGVAKCVLVLEGNKKFSGYAFCAEEDKDMKSQITGCTIALFRAQLSAFIDERDNILKPGLRALKDLYYSINRSKEYNPKSYEAKMLYRKIRQKEEDIKFLNKFIKDKKAELTKYIDDKETFYQELRSFRKGQNQSNEKEEISN